LSCDVLATVFACLQSSPTGSSTVYDSEMNFGMATLYGFRIPLFWRPQRTLSLFLRA
jgi:hypothetical protein